MSSAPSIPVSSPKPTMHLPSFVPLFKDAVSFWKEHLQSFVLFSLSMLLLFVPLVLGFGSLGIISFLSERPMFILQFVLGLFSFCSVIFLLLGSFVASIASVHLSFEGNTLGVVGAWKKAMNLKTFVNVFVGGILWMFLFLLGLLLFVLPAIYLIVPFTLWMFVAVRENLGIVESIQRSFALARGFWWTIAVRLGWMSVLSLAIQFVARGAIMGMFVLFFAKQPILFIAFTICFTFLIALFSAFFLTPVTSVLYRMVYGGVEIAKKKDLTASQKPTAKEIVQFIAILIISAILAGLMPTLPFVEESWGSSYEYEADYRLETDGPSGRGLRSQPFDSSPSRY